MGANGAAEILAEEDCCAADQKPSYSTGNSLLKAMGNTDHSLLAASICEHGWCDSRQLKRAVNEARY